MPCRYQGVVSVDANEDIIAAKCSVIAIKSIVCFRMIDVFGSRLFNAILLSASNKSWR